MVYDKPIDGIYYRIQPAGSGLDQDPLEVFLTPWNVIFCEDHPHDFGDEVVEIAGPGYEDNYDQFVLIDPKQSKITNRWTLEGFAKNFFPNHKPDPLYAEEYPEWKDLPHWSAVASQGEEGGLVDK